MKKILAITTAFATALGLTVLFATKLVSKELEEAMNLENNVDDMSGEDVSEETIVGEVPAHNEEVTSQVSDEI